MSVVVPKFRKRLIHPRTAATIQERVERLMQVDRFAQKDSTRWASNACTYELCLPSWLEEVNAATRVVLERLSGGPLHGVQYMFNVYGGEHSLNFHRDNGFAAVAVVGIAGEGDLCLHRERGGALNRELSYKPDLVDRSYHMIPGSAVLWTQRHELAGWMHGGLFKNRTSLVLRYNRKEW